MIKPWPNVRSTPLGNYRIFQIRSDIKLSPRTGEEHDFFVIDCVNWVNVIALTPDDQIVLVEQYRHGSNTIELEVPGGMIDADDASPIVAGTRELREETGYEGDHAMIVGQVFPNPAIMSNTCYTLLVRNCVLKHPTVFDHSEDLVTRLVPASEVTEAVRTGKIRHSLVVAALFHFQLWRQQNG